MEEDCGGAVAALVELFVYGFFEFGLQAFDYFSGVRKESTGVRSIFRVLPRLFLLSFL